MRTRKTSYSSRRSRVARGRKNLDRSRVIQKSHQIYPIHSRAHADLPKLPRIIVALVPKVGSVGKHRGVVAAKPICVRKAAIAGRQETLAVTPRKFPLCNTNSHPAVQTVGLAVLIRSAGAVAQHLLARELKVHFPFPDGLESPVQYVSYITAMVLPRPRTDWCPIIFSNSIL